MQQGNGNALRTRVYIDGYNLYYGCLRDSSDKWLDARALIERILPSILFEQNGEPIHFVFQITPAEVVSPIRYRRCRPYEARHR
jgi:hypothetical protein